MVWVWLWSKSLIFCCWRYLKVMDVPRRLKKNLLKINVFFIISNFGCETLDFHLVCFLFGIFKKLCDVQSFSNFGNMLPNSTIERFVWMLFPESLRRLWIFIWHGKKYGCHSWMEGKASPMSGSILTFWDWRFVVTFIKWYIMMLCDCRTRSRHRKRPTFLRRRMA